MPGSPEIPKSDSDSRYRLDGEIARGGIGAIIKSRDTDLGRDLAIKVLLDSHKDNPEVLQRFVEEAQIGGQLQHPGIAPIYELGQFADQRPFFAMKLVKGKTLARLLADRDHPTEGRSKFIGIFEHVCQTIAYAHSRGVIHRDLKPANIMVGAFGEVQVVDWGLAKVLQVGGIEDEKQARNQHSDKSIIQTTRSTGINRTGTKQTNDSQTQMGSVMGTPSYMPPEQALGKIDQLDERADVFALGALLVEILTGKPPYMNDDTAIIYQMAVRGSLKECFARLDECGADTELIQIARHCLEVEPRDRPRDAIALSKSVACYLESVETKLRKTELAKADAMARAEEFRRRRNLHFAIAAIMLFGLIGAGLAAMHFRNLESEQRTLVLEKSNLATSNLELAKNSEIQNEIAQRENYRSTIKRAELLLQNKMESRYQVADLLWETPRELRGWEWGYLMAQCPLEEWSFKTDQKGLDTLAASADGRCLATAGVDGTVVLWNVQTRQEIWRTKTGRVQHLSIDPSSRFVAVGSDDENLSAFTILDFASGQKIAGASVKGRAETAFGVDGRDFYLLTFANTLCRYETESWQPQQHVDMQTLYPYKGRYRIVVDGAGAFIGLQRNRVSKELSPEISHVLVLQDAKTLAEVKPTSLNVPTSGRRLVSRTSLTGRKTPNSGTFVLDSSRGLVVHSDDLGEVFRLQVSNSGQTTNSSAGILPGGVHYMAYDFPTDTIIAASNEGTVLVASPDEGSRNFSHNGPVRGLATLPGGRFVTGGADGRIKCWTLESPTELAANFPMAPFVHSGISGSEAIFLAGREKLFLKEKRDCRLIDLRSLQHVSWQLPEGAFFINSIRPQTDELLLLDEGVISFYDPDSEDIFGAPSRTLKIGHWKKARVGFDGSGNLLMYRIEKGRVLAWDLEQNRAVPTPEFREQGSEIGVSGTHAAIHKRSGLYVWEISTGRTIAHFAIPPFDINRFPNVLGGATPAFHPDEKLVAIVADGGQSSPKIIVWDYDEQNVRKQIEPSPGDSFQKVLFSPDGNRLIVKCSDLTIRVFDWRLGKELFSVTDATPVGTGAFAVSPDGRAIAYASHDQTHRIAKALPWESDAPDPAFYRALAEHRALTARVANKVNPRHDQTEE